MTEKKIILIIGKRGSGKSYLARQLIAAERRLLIYDVMSEYTEGIVFGTETRKMFCDFWRHIYRRRFRLIYRPIQPKVEIELLAQLVFLLGDDAVPCL